MPRLTALKLRGLIAPGRYGDGDGLWLQVRDADHRSWLFRYTYGLKQRQMGLGPFPDVSLADAREAARKCRSAVREGKDPIEERRNVKALARAAVPAMNFQQVADRYLVAHEAGWRNAKHRYQWKATLEIASKGFGNRSFASIDTGAVMAVLEPLWHERTETAARLRGRIESVLDYGTVRGWRVGDNPARWRGHLAKLLPAPSKIAKVEHYAALPWQQVSDFMAELRDQDGVAARALEFTILTAARTGEAIGARWSEIDIPAGVWTVPATRMKAAREHRVPLSSPAVAALRSVLLLRDDESGDWVFPGGRKDGSLSNMGMLMLLRRMGRGELTVHGFRSTFRDWAAEATEHAREVAESALAHTIGDKVEAAYRRGDLFEKRTQLMIAWAEHCGKVRKA